MNTIEIDNTLTSYHEFMLSKVSRPKFKGFDIDINDINPYMFDWQKVITRWCIKLGFALSGLETGLGKTRIQLAVAEAMHKKHGLPVLLLCPLAIAFQTIAEAAKMGIDKSVGIEYVKDMDGVKMAQSGILVTNYDRMKKFDCDYKYWKKSTLVCDESSIIKSQDGATTRFLIDKLSISFGSVFCFSATAGPNNELELGQHSELLRGLRLEEFKQRFFNQDRSNTSEWHLNQISIDEFFRYLLSFSIFMSKPSDIGDYDDTLYNLPPYEERWELVRTNWGKAQLEISTKKNTRGNYRLFADTVLSIGKLNKYKDDIYKPICHKALENFQDNLRDNNAYQVFWASRNKESKYMAELLGSNAVEVTGSQSTSEKEELLKAFSNKQIQAIVTKWPIAALGLNWQHATVQHVLSPNYSFELFYQGLRRLWRFGQKEVVLSIIYGDEIIQSVLAPKIARKAKSHLSLIANMKKQIKKNGLFFSDADNINQLEYGDKELQKPEFLRI